MKFIEQLDLENCSGVLSYKELSSIIVRGRIEAFHCEPHGGTSIDGGIPPSIADKSTIFTSPFVGSLPQRNNSDGISIQAQRKRAASFSEYRATDVPKRRRSASLSDTPAPSKKVMFDLVAALTEIFPDYDYRFTSSLQFVNVEMSRVVNEVNGYLAEFTENDPKFLDNLWRAVDLIMNIHAPCCDVYTYKGDRDDNGPLNDQKSLWSFHFFIFNRDTHRLCYFGCKANSKLQKYLHTIDDDDDDDEGEMGFDDSVSQPRERAEDDDIESTRVGFAVFGSPQSVQSAGDKDSEEEASSEEEDGREIGLNSGSEDEHGSVCSN